MVKPLWMDKNMKEFLSHKNVNERITSRVENFNNQVDRMSCFVDNYSSFSSHPSLPNGLMSKVTMVAKKDIMHGHSSMDSWLLPLLSAQSASIRDQYWAPNMALLPGCSASYLVADRLHWIASIMEGVAFVLTGIDSYTGYGFSFPECNASAKLLSMDLQNALSTVMVFHTTLLLIKEPHS